jgi:hypothetical protein
MTYKIERLLMTGRGNRVRWTVTAQDGTHIFSTEHGFLAWDRKKDAVKIVDSLAIHGIAETSKRLGV